MNKIFTGFRNQGLWRNPFRSLSTGYSRDRGNKAENLQLAEDKRIMRRAKRSPNHVAFQSLPVWSGLEFISIRPAMRRGAFIGGMGG